MTEKNHERLFQIAELLFFFGFAPVLVGKFVPPFAWIPVLWLAAAGAYAHVRIRHESIPPDFSENKVAVSRRQLAVRFVVAAVIVVAATAYWMPGRFLNFPRTRPYLWLTVMVLYPVLSVYPQEYLYRAYFFRRFRGLLKTERLLVVASTLSFSWVHIIFRNPYALGLTLAGGFFFADTYRRSRSLHLVCWEHACYGCLVFTAGLGEFFY